MLLRRAIVAGLALLTAAGIGVSSAAAQSTTSKSSTSKSTTSSKSSHPSTKKTRSRTTRKKERGQTAPTPERISEVQQALAKDGSFNGTPNGKWDDSTVEAMRKFQETHALNPSGKLDAPTLQKLGLGSQTAGVAAPIPPIGSTSRLSRLNTAPAQTAERQ